MHLVSSNEIVTEEIKTSLCNENYVNYLVQRKHFVVYFCTCNLDTCNHVYISPVLCLTMVIILYHCTLFPNTGSESFMIMDSDFLLMLVTKLENKNKPFKMVLSDQTSYVNAGILFLKINTCFKH